MVLWDERQRRFLTFREMHDSAPETDQVKRLMELELGECPMKPVTTIIIGALVVALAVVGYFYYQSTKNDITIQLPKVELKR
jgi:hypothetical protein